jgi:hypothetical protein
MKRLPSLIAGLALFSLSLLLGAGAIPSRIILTWSGDPATTQSVTRRTEALAQFPRAQLAKFTADPGFEAGASTVKATAVTDDLGNGLTAGHYRVDFLGLDAGTRYCYRVGDGQSWSEWNFFRMASAKAETFRFIYVGDAQNSIRSLWSRAIRSALLTAPDPPLPGTRGRSAGGRI